MAYTPPNPAASNDIIIDIVPPDIPFDTNAFFIDAMLAGSISIGIMFLVRYVLVKRRFPARLKVSTAHNNYSGDQTDARATAFRLAEILREEFQITRISGNVTIPHQLLSQKIRWHSFIQKLDEARYSSTSCSVTTMQQLFFDARFWLKRWPHK